MDSSIVVKKNQIPHLLKLISLHQKVMLNNFLPKKKLNNKQIEVAIQKKNFETRLEFF